MQLGGIRTDDLVLADVRGDRFLAVVTERQGRLLTVRPVPRGGTRTLTARQVVAHYRRAKGSTGSP